MPTLQRIKDVTLVALQNYPEIAARYAAGDPTVSAQINAFLHVMSEMSRDIETSELEPFIKSREATILADATNKGILPFAVPTKHLIEIINQHNAPMVLQSNRVFMDGQGRPWRLLQHAEIPANGSAEILAEQSEIRQLDYVSISSEPFHQYKLLIQDDLHLVRLSVRDQDQNQYHFITRWMNAKAGDYAVTLKTDTLRGITMEFGDSNSFGRTLEANTRLTIDVIESFGYLDPSVLKEAMLDEIQTANESKLILKFKTNGLVSMGADPLSVDQMRLLASYPTHDANAVFLGDFDFLVRKNFMARTNYLNVWNEAIHERYFGASIDNINHLFVSFMPKHPNETATLREEIGRLITMADSLYSGHNTVFVDVEPRVFQVQIQGTLAPSHNKELVEEQIRTLLLSNYGREKIATSYHLSDGFNLQEIIKLINQNIVAFQDRQSDFRIYTEDLTDNPVKPNQWLYMDESSITFNFQRSSGLGGGMWTVV